MANARRLAISAMSSSLNQGGGVEAFHRLLSLIVLSLELRQQIEQVLGDGSLDEIAVVSPQRSPDCIQDA